MPQALTSEAGVSFAAKRASPVSLFSVRVQEGTPVRWYEKSQVSPSQEMPVGTLTLPSRTPSAMVAPPSKSLPL